MSPSPEAVDPASRLRRRYADAPAAALLTGLGTAAGLCPVRKSAGRRREPGAAFDGYLSKKKPTGGFFADKKMARSRRDQSAASSSIRAAPSFPAAAGLR
jgi:hypothetical protein